MFGFVVQKRPQRLIFGNLTDISVGDDYVLIEITPGELYPGEVYDFGLMHIVSEAVDAFIFRSAEALTAVVSVGAVVKGLFLAASQCRVVAKIGGRHVAVSRNTCSGVPHEVARMLSVKVTEYELEELYRKLDAVASELMRGAHGAAP